MNILNNMAKWATGAPPTPGNLITGLNGFYAQNGVPWDECNIFGIRATKDFYTNKYIDLIGVATDSEICILRATTVPGPFWTPENCKKMGVSYASIICLGYHPKSHGFTNHRGHPAGMALGQRSKLRCFIDKNRNSQMDNSEGPYDEPVSAGMNIHTQLDGDTDEKVNFASAGCQVAQNRALFLSRFMPILKNSKEGKKGAAARFSYYLIDSDAFPLFKQFRALAQ